MTIPIEQINDNFIETFKWLSDGIYQGKTPLKTNSVQFIIVKILNRQGQMVDIRIKDFFNVYVVGDFKKSFTPVLRVAEVFQEVLGFKAYHAFESLGGAFNSHYGHNVPEGHAKKINYFVTNTRHNAHVNGHNVTVVAMVGSSMRNKYLYPEFISGSYKNPKGQLSMTDA